MDIPLARPRHVDLYIRSMNEDINSQLTWAVCELTVIVAVRSHRMIRQMQIMYYFAHPHEITIRFEKQEIAFKHSLLIYAVFAL